MKIRMELQEVMRAITIAAFIALVLVAAKASAADEGMRPASEKASARIAMGITARFVTLPDAPSFTAKGEGDLTYTLRGRSAMIDAGSMPRLVFEAATPPENLKALTVVVEGIAGTSPKLDWTGLPKIDLSSVDLRVRAYESSAGRITEATSPFIDVVLSDLFFSTDPIVVEGVEGRGYIDAEEMEAQLVAKAVLPDGSFPLYQEELAGKPVLIELVVGLKNFFKKQAITETHGGPQEE